MTRTVSMDGDWDALEALLSGEISSRTYVDLFRLDLALNGLPFTRPREESVAIMLSIGWKPSPQGPRSRSRDILDPE